jgi:hypothetical protein
VDGEKYKDALWAFAFGTKMQNAKIKTQNDNAKCKIILFEFLSIILIFDI